LLSETEQERCPWCGGESTRVEFMDRWHPVVHGVGLMAYRCFKSPCNRNEHEGWFEVAVDAKAG
jgi:hypothetical protein